MSTDYKIRCECGATFERDNWRVPKQVAALIDMRTQFAAIHTRSMHADIWLYGWEAQGSVFPGIFEFCAEHAALIHGDGAEIKDSTYLCRYGEARLTSTTIIENTADGTAIFLRVS